MATQMIPNMGTMSGTIVVIWFLKAGTKFNKKRYGIKSHINELGFSR